MINNVYSSRGKHSEKKKLHMILLHTPHKIIERKVTSHIADNSPVALSEGVASLCLDKCQLIIIIIIDNLFMII